MTEPKFIRLARQSTQPVTPRCLRCDKPLERPRRYWCSLACTEYARRWRRELKNYWREDNP